MKPYRRTRNPKLVRLNRRPVDETGFVETLVWLLDRARNGEIAGYAMVFVTNDGGRIRAVECAHIKDGTDPHAMLGYIERMKMNFSERQWPEGQNTPPA